MPTTLTNGIQLPDKGSVDWYNSMQSNYNLIDTHLGNTDTHVTAEDKANWNSKQGSLSQAQLDAIAQVATNTSDIATLQSGKANASHTHSSSDITDIGDYATKQYVDNSISGLVDNAPAALDTLKELSTALNDDANFASTVATALSAKANSADLATVATSGSYTDLSNKPTINDSTITIQKNGSTVDTFTTNGSAKAINISVPTKTSDITNDSNFVDTSNSAVASGITSAKVTAYDAHVADTDIHVTTADKSKWNTGVSQSYVLRYSSSSVTDNSTIAYSTLDNTDNIKSGDKVIDVDGKIFSVVSVDTANQTVTVGTALVDLALDANVVHTSGEESIIGNKRFGVVQSFTGFPTIRLYSTSDDINVLPSYAQQQDIRFTDKNNNIIAYFIFQHRTDANEPFRTCWRQVRFDGTDNYYSVNFNNLGEFYPENNNAINLGRNGNRWKSVYATNYYYGSNNVEFSTKFVTTDTNQTISGNKTFSSNTYVYNSDNTAYTPNLILQSSKIQLGDTTNSDTQSIVFNAGNSFVSKIESFKDTAGTQNLQNTVRTKDTSNNVISAMYRLRLYNTGFASLESSYDNTISLGRNNARWKDCQTYLINGLTPSSLSMPVIDRTKYIDISSYFTNTATGEYNSYSVPANGWIFLRLGTISSCQASVLDSDSNLLYGTTTTGSVEQVLLPVIAGTTFQTQWATGSAVVVATAKFIPCQGNV